MRLVEALEIEKDRAKGHDHDQEPLVVLKRIDRIRQIEPFRAVETQRVRGEKRDREDERVDELLELRV